MSLHTLRWTNPDHNVDGSNYDAATQNSGYNVRFDNGPAVSLPLSFDTTFDLTRLAEFNALSAGTHSIQLQVVAQTGEVSQWSAAYLFTINTVPNSPFDLSVV